ncbi:SUMF1/EgtB/PvdO family nonheme iron enzyme, partial [bacterium]|nr:SUMF1/EgtB/PvdO family nonheme iron enzyme [bacterium]
SRKGYKPWAFINHFQAGAACIRANKRLCTRGEWGDACDGVIGPGGWRYPYGDDFDWSAKTCNRRDNDNLHFSPTGSYEACVSRFGAYDMNGNYWEWDADEVGSYPVHSFGRRGADFSHNNINTDKCYNIYLTIKDGRYEYDDTSFRCCK